MQLIPIKTRIMHPPQDDLFSVFDEYLTDVREGDVIVVTSKVVSIHLGLCTPIAEVDKHELTKLEADAVIMHDEYRTLPLTIKHHTLLYRAGIDESNSGDYYTVLPPNPYKTAAIIRRNLIETFSLKKLGIIISDSTVLPFRHGVIGISLGVAGFIPNRTHSSDAKDLFGVPMIETSTNLADAIAAGSSVVSGEADQSTPIVIARGVPDIKFVDEVDATKFVIDPKRDLYAPLLEKYFLG